MRALCILVFAASLTLGTTAAAQTGASARAEAHSRFDRGLTFFDERDNERALAEFRRAYDLAPNSRVLYNIGLVLAAAGRPAEATEALEQVLADPGKLGVQELKTLRVTLQQQRTKVAELSITANVPAAHISIDSVAAGSTPLQKPLRIASGTRIVTVEAQGYAPLRREITIAGGVGEKLDFQLVPLEGRLAHLVFRVVLPDVDVYAEGQRVARTPIDTTLTFPPGPLHIELRRQGYRTVTRSIDLGDGASGEIAADPEVDPNALDAQGGSVEVTASETGATLKIDGKSAGLVGHAVRVPSGRHRVSVLAGGFEPSESLVTVERGRTLRWNAHLEPTPETRTIYERAARSRRTTSFVVMGSGLAVAIGGTVMALVGNTAAAAGARDFKTIEDDHREPGTCDDRCLATGQDALAHERNGQALRGVGIGVAAAGAVGLGVGAVLWLTGNDVHRYDHARLAPKASGSGLAWVF